MIPSMKTSKRIYHARKPQWKHFVAKCPCGNDAIPHKKANGFVCARCWAIEHEMNSYSHGGLGEKTKYGVGLNTYKLGGNGMTHRHMGGRY